MATIRLHGNKWQARIYKKGYPTQIRSFLIKRDAEQWARLIETDIEKGAFTNTNLAEQTTFKALIERYMREVTPSMQSMHVDLIKLNALSKKPIGQLNMLALTPSKIAEFRDQRLKEVKPGTVIRDLCYFSSIINHARREWGINISNPVILVKKPPSPKGRSRILTDEERIRLMQVLEAAPKNHFSMWLPDIVEFALETAMRLGEITSLRWENVNLLKRVAFLPLTKNGDSRDVPLSSAAIKILNALPRSIEGRVFPVNKTTVSARFTRLARKANLLDLKFHDLRHTAITQMAGKLSNVLELSAVTGHKTLGMLKRYTHLKAEDLAKKLG